jgi:hypothetical protein
MAAAYIAVTHEERNRTAVAADAACPWYDKATEYSMYMIGWFISLFVIKVRVSGCSPI